MLVARRSSLLLLLLLAARAAAFVPSRQVRTSVFVDSTNDLKKSNSRVTAGLLGTDSSSMEQPIPIPSTDSKYEAEVMQIAQGYLTEILEAVQLARQYLNYMEDVAKVVREYLERLESTPAGTAATPLNRPDLPVFKDEAEVRAYLSTVEKSTAAAQDYLNYLEQVASDVRNKLAQFAGAVPAAGEAYLEELEDTVRAAKDYLTYLQDVAESVKAYLLDPRHSELPQFSSLQRTPLNGAPAGTGGWNGANGGDAKWSPPATATTNVRSESLPAANAADDSASSVAQAAPAWSAPAAPAPPAGIDYMSSLGGAAVKKAPIRGKPKVPTKSTGYLDNMGSPPSTPAWGAGVPAAPAAPAFPSTAGAAPAPPAGGDYMSSLGGGAPVKKAARGKPKVPTKSTGYLDTMGSPPSTPAWGAGVPATAPPASETTAAPAPPVGDDYMTSLGGGAPVKKAPLRGKPKVPTRSMGSGSYLDSMGSPPSTPAWGTVAAKTGPSAPAPPPAAAAMSADVAPKVAPPPKTAPPPPPAAAAMSADVAPKVASPTPETSQSPPKTSPPPKAAGPPEPVPAPAKPPAPAKTTSSTITAPAGQTSSGYLGNLKSNIKREQTFMDKVMFGDISKNSISLTGSTYLSKIGGGKPIKKTRARGKPKTVKKVMGGGTYLENMSKPTKAVDWSQQSGTIVRPPARPSAPLPARAKEKPSTTRDREKELIASDMFPEAETWQSRNRRIEAREASFSNKMEGRRETDMSSDTEGNFGLYFMFVVTVAILVQLWFGAFPDFLENVDNFLRTVNVVPVETVESSLPQKIIEETVEQVTPKIVLPEPVEKVIPEAVEKIIAPEPVPPAPVAPEPSPPEPTLPEPTPPKTITPEAITPEAIEKIQITPDYNEKWAF